MKTVLGLLVCLLYLSLKAGAQQRREWDFDPDTIRTLYFSYAYASQVIWPDSNFSGTAVRTVLQPNGDYEDQMSDFQSQKLLFKVYHSLSKGHATLRMYYPSGALRLKAEFLEDFSKTPTAFLIPSLRKPLAAYAQLDGAVTTYYPNGNLRQKASYRLGLRTAKQCYHADGRPAECNDNALFIPAELPLEAQRHQFFDYWVSSYHEQNLTLKSKAVFSLGPRGELKSFTLRLPPGKLSSESVACLRKSVVYPVRFAIFARGNSSINIRSAGGNNELRDLALNAGRIFANNKLQSALFDGEQVTTFCELPVILKL